MTPSTRFVTFAVAVLTLHEYGTVASAEPLQLQLREQTPVAPDSGAFRTRSRDEQWEPKSTAVIVCDVWDYHHCRNAVDRLEEFGPRLNEVVRRARQLGATIIHAPSDCMPAYVDHPARMRTLSVPRAAKMPENVDQWCSLVPAERNAVYPIDQSDGGEDDDSEVHARWAAKLTSLGRNPAMPWRRQSEMIEIDGAVDFVSDSGEEVWNILEARGIRHVILTGVHLNMCVLGRPFGLRRMVLGGKQVVLLRDLTDTMYDPTSWPYINHFTANDRLVDHVERYVCPTMTSDQLLGGKPFRYGADKRPHLAIVVAEEGYGTKETLTKFAADQLGRDFRVSFVYGQADDARELPGLELLEDADLALFSVRRHVLKPEKMAIVRRFISAGKPVLGIRTASHAFALNKQSPPAGYEAWPEFDVDVFGGHYEGHSTTKSEAVVSLAPRATDDPLLNGVRREPQRRPGGLYGFAALSPRAELLVSGEQDGVRQPIAWTFSRPDGGRSFYTSLGERQDFANPDFVQLLHNAVYWSAGLTIPASIPAPAPRQKLERHWSTVAVPGAFTSEARSALQGYQGPIWFRCVVRMPKNWRGQSPTLALTTTGRDVLVWWNGAPIIGETEAGNAARFRHIYRVDAETIAAGDANLLVVRAVGSTESTFPSAPKILDPRDDASISLEGRWQFRIGDDPTWSNMPLPAKFGASTDMVFDPQLDGKRR